MNRLSLSLLLGALLAGTPALHAQEPEPQATLDLAGQPGRMGGSQSGFLGLFDNSTNPAIGVAFDVLAEFSGADDGAARYNQLRARSLELSVAHRYDPYGWAYAYLVASDTGAESEIEVEEAAMWFDQLPADLSLRAGRFLADFGKWNTTHTHDKPFMNEDGVRREFLGGPLILDGVEMHQWFGLGDMPVRWSLGLASAAEGHDHDGGGHDHAHGEAEPFGRRGLDNWTATGRFTGQIDVGSNGYFQWGLSGLYAPGILGFEDPDGVPDSGDEERLELRRAVTALDLTWRDVDAATNTADTVGVELWHHRGQFEEPGGPASGGANGLWGFYEHQFSPRWAAGVHAAWWEHAEEGAEEWFHGDEAGASRAAFLTWSLSEFNRLRLQLSHHDPGPDDEDYLVLGLQWTVILGSHSHSVDW
jgi:hypothetical protein